MLFSGRTSQGRTVVLKGQQLLDGTLTGYPPPTLSLMKEAFAKSWPVVSAKYEGVEATAQGRLRLARAVVAVTSPTATNADDIARMAIDYVTLEERDADAPSGRQPGQDA
jgi:hypothetical protein